MSANFPIRRRTFLRGLGTAVALPVRDSLLPARALGATAAAPNFPKRVAWVYVPNGANMADWTPAATGANYALSPILEPLKPFQQQLTIVSGLGNRPAQSAAVHAIVPGTWLSCVHPRETHEAYGGVTVDQMAAAHIGQDTPLPSIQLCIENAGSLSAACGFGYSCVYCDTISWASAKRWMGTSESMRWPISWPRS